MRMCRLARVRRATRPHGLKGSSALLRPFPLETPTPCAGPPREFVPANAPASTMKSPSSPLERRRILVSSPALDPDGFSRIGQIGQDRSGSVRIGQIGQVRSDLDRSGYVIAGQVQLRFAQPTIRRPRLSRRLECLARRPREAVPWPPAQRFAEYAPGSCLR